MRVRAELLSKADSREGRVLGNWMGYDVGFRIDYETEMDVPVTHEIAEEFGIDVILKGAAENIEEPVIKGMSEMLGFSVGKESMWVVTNETKHRGASTLVRPDAYEVIRQVIPDGTLALIPSSIHEWIVTKLEGEVDDITEIIGQVNNTQVAREDQLGDEPLIVTDKIMTVEEWRCKK